MTEQEHNVAKLKERLKNKKFSHVATKAGAAKIDGPTLQGGRNNNIHLTQDNAKSSRNTKTIETLNEPINQHLTVGLSSEK